MNVVVVRSCSWGGAFPIHLGLTENAGRENDGPSKLQGMKLQDMKLMDQFAGHEIRLQDIKLQDMKLTDQCAGHEIVGHEHDGPKMTAGREIAGQKKYNFYRDNYNEVCKFLNPQHCNRAYTVHT